MGILYKKSTKLNIFNYSSAEQVGSKSNKRSTSGYWYCTFVEGYMITWKSKKQNVVAKYSTKAEVEYHAMARAACKLM